MKIKKLLRMTGEVCFVRVKGLEPPRLAAPDPKSGVSTNFTTPAGFEIANILRFFVYHIFWPEIFSKTPFIYFVTFAL